MIPGQNQSLDCHAYKKNWRDPQKWFWRAAILAPFLYWLWCATPWIFQIYDLDPSDGDVVNAALRIKQGLPLYGDWTQGEIYGNYGPLYYFLIAGVSLVIDMDSLVFSLRLLNVGLIFGAFLCGLSALRTIFFTRVSLPNSLGSSFAPLLVFSVSFWLLMGDHLIGALTLQSNAFFLFLQVALLVCVVRQRVWATVFIASLLPFVKQSGVAASCAAIVALISASPRSLWPRILGGAAALPLLWILGLELWSHGHFLQASFFYPREVFSVPGTWSAEHPESLLRAFFFDQLWVYYGLLVLFLVASFFYSSIRAIAILSASEILMFSKIAHNIGGSITYLYFLGTLLALGTSLLYLEARQSRAALPKVSKSLVSLFALVLVCASALGAINMHTKRHQRVSDESNLLKFLKSPEHASAVEFLSSHREHRWFSNRFAMPLVSQGILLDVEACTLQFALEKEGFVQVDHIENRFRKGHYPYVWYSDAFRMPLIEELLEDCYKPLKSFPWPFRSKSTNITIYQHFGC